MTGLSDPVPILGHHGGYAAGAALFSGRQIVLALLVIAAVSVILWIPVSAFPFPSARQELSTLAAPTSDSTRQDARRRCISD